MLKTYDDRMIYTVLYVRTFKRFNHKHKDFRQKIMDIPTYTRVCRNLD